MNLRGHHLLCLLGFQGNGYSDSFVKIMKLLAPIYRDENNDFEIFINPNTDEICEACPAIEGKNCTTFKKVDIEIRKLDDRIIKHLGLEAGKFYTKKYIFDAIRREVEPNDLQHLCKGCKWLEYGVCEKAIREFKLSEK